MYLTERFLRAKHWQLFLVLFGLPFLLHIVFTIGIFIAMLNDKEPNLQFILNGVRLMPLIVLLLTGFFFGWLWSIAMGLQQKIPPRISLKVKRFKILFFIPFVYLSFIMLLIVVFTASLRDVNQWLPDKDSEIEFIWGSVIVIFFLYVFSLFCIGYIFYFVAKTIKTVELQREVNFGEFAGEFFLIWFFPLGIWIIQPQVNRMAQLDNAN